MSTPKFEFLKDEPLTTDGSGYFDFYHASLAPALKKILKNKTSPHTIGLFGAWGTGKSTIIEMVQKDPTLKLPLFIFDAWKYQEDTLRRTFLIKLVDFLRSEGIELKEDILKPLYTSTTLSVSKEQKSVAKLSRKQRVWVFIKRYSLMIVTGLALLGYILLNIFMKDSTATRFIKEVLSTVAAISFISLLIKPILEGILKQAAESLFKKREQQTELVTEIQQEERLNSPEQFEEKFRDILKVVNKKLVVVFDNIDRVQGDVAISMLSTIKTFMYSGPKGLVFIVPCDPSAIEIQVSKYFYQTGSDRNDGFNSSEYLRKIFNLILWVPEFISTDLEEYTKACLKSTGEVSKLLDEEDVILVINSAFSKNPREIIQFINNLVAMVITAQGTGVKDIINGNIAYLAKVLILRQRFPRAYERLKDNWYKPEDILAEGKVDEDLISFLDKTNRITVDDAEPFIYFKDPAGSRGLVYADELKNALVSGDKEVALNVAKKESDQTKVVEFITDLIGKYSGQERVLLNVITAQFHVVNELDLKVKTKNYFDGIAHSIDSQLWGQYQSLPINDIFAILTNELLTNHLRGTLVERFVASLETKDGSGDIDKVVLDNLRHKPDLLNKQQLIKVRQSIEDKYSESEGILNTFTGVDEQERFITKQLLLNYISTFDYKNIRTRMVTISGYKKYVISQQLLPSLIDRVTERLVNDNGIDPDYNSNKKEVIDAVTPLVKTFREELNNSHDSMSPLVSALVQAYDGTSNWENWVKEIIAMWWVRDYVTVEDKTILDQNINDFFSKGPQEGWIQVLDYWDSPTTERFIAHILPNILPELTSNEALLDYIYDNASKTTQSHLLSELIQRVPVDNPYTINFLGKKKQIPDRKKIIKELLLRAGQQTYTQKLPYYQYIAKKIYKSDARDLKDEALSQIKALVMTASEPQGEVGLNFFNELEFLTDNDQREVAREVLTWLRDPGRSIDSTYRIAFVIVTQAFSLMQETPQRDYVYFLFSLLEPSRDALTIQFVLSALKQIAPSYQMYTKDYGDLLVRLQSWPDDQNKVALLQELPSLISKKPRKNEQSYWESIQLLQNQK